MLKIRCKNCNSHLESHPSQTRCCGCDNFTMIKDDKISAIDLSLVELVNNSNSKKASSHFTAEELQYQESRRNRKVRKMEFEVK